MWPFRTKDRSSVVLIDIGSSSVAGAYAHFREDQLPSILYTACVPLSVRENESIEAAMIRALDDVGKQLVEQGAPTLHRETGNGHIDHILVSVAAPWQETGVRTEIIDPGKPFTFSRNILSEVVASSHHVAEGRVASGESVVATILNGYELSNPMGRRAKRAEVVILSSTLDAQVTEKIRERVRHFYHSHDISFTAFAPVAYSVMRDLFPHEKDFLVLDVSGTGTDLAFVKNGLLVDVGTTPHGTSTIIDTARATERMAMDEAAGTQRAPMQQPGYGSADRSARFSAQAEKAKEDWLQSLSLILKQFAEHHPLPRTLFLLADPHARDYIKRALDTRILHSLWLSDEPLAIIPLLEEHLTSRIRVTATTESNLYLSILALYQQNVRTL